MVEVKEQKVSKIIIVIGVAIAMIALGALFLTLRKDEDSAAEVSKKVEGSCSERADILDENAEPKLYDNAITALQEDDNVVLKSLVDELKTFEDHDVNTDCLIVTTAYHTFVAELDEAKRYLALLEDVYDPDVLIADGLYGEALDVENIRFRVESLDKMLNGDDSVKEQTLVLFSDDEGATRGGVDYSNVDESEVVEINPDQTRPDNE